MNRLTRPLDQWPCRLAKACTAEEWFYDHLDLGDSFNGDLCEDCPFMEIINRLGFYEDLFEKSSDDGK